MTSASPNYFLLRLAIVLLPIILLSTLSTASASTAGYNRQSSPKPQAAEQKQRSHQIYNTIIPVKHMNFHDATTNAGTNANTKKNEFDRLNNRRYYGGRVTRAQVHEAVVQTTRHSHTNEIYVMGVASMN